MSASEYRTHYLSNNQKKSVKYLSIFLIMTQLDFEKSEESLLLLLNIVAKTEREFKKLILMI